MVWHISYNSTQIQPWHTAVEVSLGVDLYDAQIRVAMEDDLGWKQTDIRFSGHTLSMMIYSKGSGYITEFVYTI